MAQSGKRIPKAFRMEDRLPRVLLSLDTMDIMPARLPAPHRLNPRLLNLPNFLKPCLDLHNSKLRSIFLSNNRTQIISPLQCFNKVVLPFKQTSRHPSSNQPFPTVFQRCPPPKPYQRKYPLFP